MTKFMKASRVARVESHESVGLGMDYRMELTKITGFSLSEGEIARMEQAIQSAYGSNASDDA